jgi:hypothetical protein
MTSRRHEAEEPHVFVQLVPVHGAAQRRVFRDLVADDEQAHVIEAAAAAERMEGLDQALEVLVRLDVPRIQDERAVELVALAHALDFLRRRRLAEPLVDRVVDHVDLLFRDPEVPEDVALRRLRDGEHAVRPVRRHPERRAGIRVGDAVGQVLREPEVDAVVDRDDRPASRRGGT